MESAKIRPRVAVLWNGVSLEELGIADLLKSADLTLTIGRTNPSTRFPTGKPKVGGASVVLLLPDKEAGRRVLSLLYANPRPMLTMGFGFHGGKSYWLGDANVRTKPDMRQFARVHGYKIDNVSWDYSSNYPTVTLNGMAGHTLGLVESRKPRTWAGKTLADISRELSEQFGVVIRISGRVPANRRIENAVQYANESALDALDRLTRLSGAGLHVATMVASAVPGASKAYDYVFDHPAGQDDHWADDQAQIRTVITIKSIEEDFVDLDALEQTRPLRIAWAPHLTPRSLAFSGSRLARDDERTKHGNYDEYPDYVAQSIRATEENVARAAPVAAGVSKKGESLAAQVVKEIYNLPFQMMPGIFGPGALQIDVVKTPQGQDGSAATKSVPVAPTRSRIKAMSLASEANGGEAMTSAQVQAALYAAGIKTRLQVEMSPGAPEITTGASVEILGTYTHDGLYGVEEVRVSIDPQGGLKTTHTIRPVLGGGTRRVPDPGSAKKELTAPERETYNLPYQDRTGSFGKGALQIDIVKTPQGQVDGAGELSPVGIPVQEEVPAAPNDAALEADIQAGGE